MSKLKESPIYPWLLLIALATIWGSSYILIKRGLTSFSSLQVGAYRVLITALAFLPYFIKKFKTIKALNISALLVVGFCGIALPSILFPLAQQQLSSSLAGALSSTTPLTTLVVGLLLYQAPFNGKKFFGVLVGFLGTLILVNSRYGLFTMDAALPWINICFVLMATISYAISSNHVKAKLPDVKSIFVTCGSIVPMGFIALITLSIIGFSPVPEVSNQQTIQSFLAIVVLALLGTALATFLFFEVVRLRDPIFASIVSYLIPFVALGWGIIDGEIISFGIVVGLAITLLGVRLTRS